MSTTQNFAQALDAPFSISDLAERTGLTPATLRTWEARHGFPEPVRRPGGHRRYTDGHVDQVRHVLRRRAEGLTLEAAIHEAARPERAESSVFAGLRRRHPGLPVRTLRKATLLALSHAMEDECCARAQGPLLLAAFQHERYLKQALPRWRELSRTAEAAVVFAAFTAPAETETPAQTAAPEHRADPLEVHVPERSAVRREWFLVCDAPDLPACLSAWEIPGQEGVRDRDRLFESVWSLDPTVVRDAATITLSLAQGFAADRASELPALPSYPPAESSPAATEATMLFHRVLDYVDRIDRG